MKPKIKICGIVNIKDAQYAIKLGVDYLGFIVDFPKTPRNNSLDEFLKTAKYIKEKKYKRKPKIVAVTVDMPMEKIKKIINSKTADIIQLHGNETVEYCKKNKNKIILWKSFKPAGVSAKQLINKIKKYKNHINRFVLDASDARDKEARLKKQFNGFNVYKKLQFQNYPLALAGGLNPDNINYYIKKLNPEIVDAASGVESKPGVKDFKKMDNFVNNALNL